jgi:hypothetical protein
MLSEIALTAEEYLAVATVDVDGHIFLFTDSATG